MEQVNMIPSQTHMFSVHILWRAMEPFMYITAIPCVSCVSEAQGILHLKLNLITFQTLGWYGSHFQYI